MSMTWSHGVLRTKLDSALAAIAGKEGVIRGFNDWVCKGSSLVVRAQSTSYCDRLNAVHADVQLKEKYLGGFCVRVSENGQSLYISDDNSD